MTRWFASSMEGRGPNGGAILKTGKNLRMKPAPVPITKRDLKSMDLNGNILYYKKTCIYDNGNILYSSPSPTEGGWCCLLPVILCFSPVWVAGKKKKGLKAIIMCIADQLLVVLYEFILYHMFVVKKSL